MTTAAARTRWPLLSHQLTCGLAPIFGLAFALILLLPQAALATVSADMEIGLGSQVIVDKGGLEEAGNFPPTTLVVRFLGEVDSLRTVMLEDFRIPDTEGAAHEHFEFSFETSPGVFKSSRDLELYWDLETGHAVSEVFMLRTSFVSVFKTLASADYEMFLTTDATGQEFGDEPLPTFCGANTLEVAVAGQPFSLGDGGAVTLAAVGCPLVTNVQMGSYGTSVSVAAAVPEPQPWLLQISAFGALGVLVRRRASSGSATL